MIKFITGRVKQYNWRTLNNHDIFQSDLKEFEAWVRDNDSIQYDIETTMEKDGPKALLNREIVTLQFGNEDEEIFVIEVQFIPPSLLKKYLKPVFNPRKQLIAHNARFEYTMTKIHLGFVMENIHDTMLMSQVLNTGLDFEGPYHSLEAVCFRWLDVTMDKTYQTSFVKDTLLSPNQIIYAATDVAPMHDLMKRMEKQLRKWRLWDLYNNIERHFLKVMGDMETSPMGFDAVYWRKLGNEFLDLTKKHEEILNRETMNDPYLYHHLLTESKEVINQYMIQPYDTCTISWAGKNKKDVFRKFLPSEVAEMTKKPEITKWYKENKESLSEEQDFILDKYLNRKFIDINNYLVSNYKDWMLENNLFIPQGNMNVNWNSTPQKLFAFRFYRPELMKTDAKTLAKVNGIRVIDEYKRYAKVSKFNSTYGLGFIDKNTIDGKYFAPRGGQQILATGRLSFGIALTMPSRDAIAAKLRNGFLPPLEDWKILTTDYASAELVIMAKLAGEERIIQGVKDGLDIHSMSASLMFPEKWADIAEPGCEHIKSGKKCSCKEHNKFRGFSKSISFGCA